MRGPIWHFVASSMLFGMATAVATAADLTGIVSDETGNPAAGAVVYVYEVSPRQGTGVMDASSYPDRGKLAITDDAGAFTIAGLDENLLFKIVVAAEEHPSLLMNKVDPAKGPLKAKLKPIDPARKELSYQLRGKVSDANGPVIGAEIEPFGMRNGKGRWWGQVTETERIAITNGKGEFLLTSKDPDVAIDVHVSSKNHATVNYSLLQTGEQVHELNLNSGASIKGRVLNQGQPVAGIVMGAVQADRESEHFTGIKEAVTDDQGAFTLEHLGPNVEYVIYGKMKSVSELGSVPIQRATTQGDEDVLELTEVEIQPAYTVSGRVRLSDEKPIPSNVTLYLGREDAWDSQTIKLPKDGAFKFTGVPSEAIILSVRIKGYHLAEQNVSLDVVNPFRIMGLVDDDIIDLDILMEPGEPENNHNRSSDHQRLKTTRLEGVPKE
jgi:protocatechuate 3,4-dioxygenase beta subunit